MELLRTWAITFCVCSFAVLFFKLLCPKGNMEKSMNIILSLFMIIALVSPFANGKTELNLDINTDKISENINSSAVNEYSSSVLKTELRNLTNKVLNNIEIDDYELEIELELSESGGINILKYDIKVPVGTDTEKVKKTIETEIGVSPTVSEAS